jgi:hypothetical protein
MDLLGVGGGVRGAPSPDQRGVQGGVIFHDK